MKLNSRKKTVRAAHDLLAERGLPTQFEPYKEHLPNRFLPVQQAAAIYAAAAVTGEKVATFADATTLLDLFRNPQVQEQPRAAFGKISANGFDICSAFPFKSAKLLVATACSYCYTNGLTRHFALALANRYPPCFGELIRHPDGEEVFFPASLSVALSKDGISYHNYTPGEFNPHRTVCSRLETALRYWELKKTFGDSLVQLGSPFSIIWAAEHNRDRGGPHLDRAWIVRFSNYYRGYPEMPCLHLNRGSYGPARLARMASDLSEEVEEYLVASTIIAKVA